VCHRNQRVDKKNKKHDSFLLLAAYKPLTGQWSCPSSLAHGLAHGEAADAGDETSLVLRRHVRVHGGAVGGRARGASRALRVKRINKVIIMQGKAVKNTKAHRSNTHAHKNTRTHTRARARIYTHTHTRIQLLPQQADGLVCLRMYLREEAKSKPQHNLRGIVAPRHLVSDGNVHKRLVCVNKTKADA